MVHPTLHRRELEEVCVVIAFDDEVRPGFDHVEIDINFGSGGIGVALHFQLIELYGPAHSIQIEGHVCQYRAARVSTKIQLLNQLVKGVTLMLIALKDSFSDCLQILRERHLIMKLADQRQGIDSITNEVAAVERQLFDRIGSREESILVRDLMKKDIESGEQRREES